MAMCSKLERIPCGSGVGIRDGGERGLAVRQVTSYEAKAEEFLKETD